MLIIPYRTRHEKQILETFHLDYLREHLRILSGFYGLLRPFDGVTPYRLEMQARLSVDGYLIPLYGSTSYGQVLMPPNS